MMPSPRYCVSRRNGIMSFGAVVRACLYSAEAREPRYVQYRGCRAEARVPSAKLCAAVVPRLEASSPQAEAIVPRLEASSPQAEAVVPRLEASSPQAESVVPRLEASFPQAEAGVLRLESSKLQPAMLQRY